MHKNGGKWARFFFFLPFMLSSLHNWKLDAINTLLRLGYTPAYRQQHYMCGALTICSSFGGTKFSFCETWVYFHETEKRGMGLWVWGEALWASGSSGVWPIERLACWVEDTNL